MPAPSHADLSARAELHGFFSMTDRFQAQLSTVAEALVPIQVTAVTRAADADIQAQAKAKARLRCLVHTTKGASPPADAKATQSKQNAELDFESLLHLSLVVYGKQIEEEVRQAVSDPSMQELGEMESLRLQMAMDRLSKMMSTLSNLLKKIADTQTQLVQNLK